MTGKRLIDTFFDDFNKFPVVGRKNPFMDYFGSVASQENYPPYNIIKTANGYLIEMAVPGWDREDLQVSFEDRLLKISGKKRELEEDTSAEYVFKSLSTKAFNRSWVVDKDLEVESVFLENGLLCVDLCRTEPEQPKLLTIE